MIGASIALIPHFVAAKLFFKDAHRSPNAILRMLYGVQLLKWLTTIGLFALVFSYFSLEPWCVLTGFMLAQIFQAFWGSRISKQKFK